jgi:hypothetical protein
MQLDSRKKDLKESKAALVFAFSNTSRRQDAPGALLAVFRYHRSEKKSGILHHLIILLPMARISDFLRLGRQLLTSLEYI